MSATDPLGYYAALGVSPNVTAAELKAAFRKKAMEYHPDRCKLPNATILFQQVNQAFSVLGDPESRARYDTSRVETSDSARPASSSQAAPEPIRCSVCSKVSAQPRYVIFYRVYSFIIMTRREAVQGIYCSACAEKECLKATAFSWALSWWGFPWGPIYGLQAILTNLVGGKRPADINARVLAHQAWYFAATGQAEVARAVAEQALALALKVPPTRDDEAARLRAQLDAFIASFPPSSSTPKLKETWHLARRPFFVQAGIFAAVALFLTFALLRPDGPKSAATDYSSLWNEPGKPHHAYNANPVPDTYSPGTLLNTSVEGRPTTDAPVAVPPATPRVVKPSYVRPALAPTGKPWPVAAGYIRGLPQKFNDGHSEITIDNGRNNSDMFVKVVVVYDNAPDFPIRQLFLPAHGSFTVKNVRPGSYDIRFQNLDTGTKSGSPSFELTETHVADGIEYSRYELTLYTVANGNLQMRTLADDDF
ncbi:J domain-containing protein [Dyella jiangningensis]|uniref:J domain-containing protein n=1 Tax=Dyella jiangningensis TaxID=1379159 RepID=UPI00240EB599|nr:J domain-containing protein [Dyella jiangningensis]MDG2539204.1 J domain-containing protein [Dyella jiangningensis]